MNNKLIGGRLRALREKRGLKQEELARILEVESRQTVTQIEQGKRRLTAKELLSAVAYFGVPMEQFTNPYLLAGDARFSWRQRHVKTEDLTAFETRAGEWIGAYRELSRQAGVVLPAIMPRLGLTYRSSFEDADAAGEAVSRQLELGMQPATRLAEVMEEKLGILVLMVDTIPGISGAACTLPELNAVIVNRHDSLARRNFDLAHELFHLMTWDTMPPSWIDGDAKSENAKRIKRVEQLADSFAAALLMPSYALDELGAPTGDLPSWINAAATYLGVSGSALKWQLVNSGRGPRELKELTDEELREARLRSSPDALPPLFGKRFVDRIASSIKRGHISASRAAALMNISLDELGELCRTFEIDVPDELQFAGVAAR